MKIADLSWNQDVVLKLKENIKARNPTLLYGNAGVGKSSSVYIVAEELNYNVSEINGSDERTKDVLDALLSRVSKRHLGREIIYFIDECEYLNAWATLEKILSQSKHPVVLACNQQWKIPDNILNRCVQLKYLDPPLTSVVNVVRQRASAQGITPKYERINADFRGGVNAALWGGSKHDYSDMFSKVEKIFRSGGIPPDIDDSYLIWLMDNSHRFFWGRRLYEFLQLLCWIDLLPSTLTASKWKMLSEFCANDTIGKMSGKVTYPYYRTRQRVLSRKKK